MNTSRSPECCLPSRSDTTSLNQEHADQTAAGRSKPRRRRRLLTVAASILAVLAGYTTWTNTRADEAMNAALARRAELA